MYAGAITLAAPTARPPKTRQNTRLHGPNASAEPIALMMKMIAATDHDLDAADPVGDRPGEPGADRAAEQRRRHDEADRAGRDVELGFDRVDRAVDDRGVESEEESAERGGDRDQQDSAVVRPIRARFRSPWS